MSDEAEIVQEKEHHETAHPEVSKIRRCLSQCQRLARGVKLDDIHYELSSAQGDQVDTASLLGMIEHCENDTDKISHHVDLVRQFLNKWSLRVILWDAISVMLLGITAYVILFINNIGTPEQISQSAYFLASTRPMLVAIIFSLLIIFMISLHFSIRKLVANRLLKTMKAENQTESVMSLFRRSVRARHSIFRPEPAGWHLWQQWRFRKIRSCLLTIRSHLPGQAPTISET